MKGAILFLFLASSALGQGTLSPLNPTVTQNGTVTISCTANCGTGSSWSCSGCAGTLSNQAATTVQYNAPATITPKQSIAGYQLLPNDHIFNTNVSGLSAHVNSLHWMTDGFFNDNFSNAPAPTISCSNSGGSLATATYFVKYTYKWAFGAGLPNGETKGSAEASCSLTGPSGSVTVTAPIIPTNVQGYTVYDSTTTGTEKQQAASAACVNITTSCVIQVLGAGANVPASMVGGAGILTFQPSNRINYLSSFPINYTNNSTPTDTLSFFYTPANNGVFESPQFPNVVNEGGWYDARENRSIRDHHFITINTTNGNTTERYQYYCSLPTTAASVNGSNVATITFGSNPIPCGITNGASVCVGGFTGGDTFFNVCPVTVTTITPTTISFSLTHALAAASTNGSVTLNVQASGCSTAGTCNSQSGIKYNAFTYSLPPISTDAAGMQLEPLILRVQELEQAFANSGTINHALRATFTNGALCTCFVWPASTNASPANFLPYGSRFRLRSTASFPINGFSANDQVLLKQLNQYGLIAADGGSTWQINMEAGPFSQAMQTSFLDINNAVKTSTITNTAVSNHIATILASNDLLAGYDVNITGTTNGAGCLNAQFYTVVSATSSQFQVFTSCSNFGSASDSGTLSSYMENYIDVVDESSLMEIATSGAASNGEVVTYTSSTGSVSTNVALQGPSVGFAKDFLYIMAGTPAQQLPAFSTNGGLTCSMSPSVGSLSAGCLYTAPATLASASSITVTATNASNGNVAASMTVWVCPQAGCRFAQANLGTDYTDTDGNVWKGGWGLGTVNVPNVQGCCQVNLGFPHINNYQLWQNHLNSSLTLGDYFVEARVPAGSYQVIYRLDSSYNGPLVISAQGQPVLGGIAAGVNPQTFEGAASLPFGYTFMVSVGSDNKLLIPISDDGTSGLGGDISSISIIPGSLAPQQGRLP